jgi:predicted metal-dependent hydrolase
LKNNRQNPEVLKNRVRHWAEQIGVAVKEIHIRPMTTKWASCSTTGRVTLAADVLPLSRRLQDYIIVHELLHLRVPNHGKLWKTLMRAYVGDYEKIERRLQPMVIAQR